ncbi:MAG: hypothetical protein ACM3QS_11795 [Bacteroidota bacterium]
MRLAVRYALTLALLLLGTSVLFPFYCGGPYPHPAGPVFNREVSRLYLHEIERERPQMVLLGDSMLTKGVDLQGFRERAGIPTYKLDIPGSSSALWYLVLKSNIIPADPAPRTVVILFRDTLLTAATFRTTGPYFGLIDKFASPEDTLLRERAYLAALGPLQTALEEYLPLFTYRGEVRESVDAGLRHAAPALVSCDRTCADDAMTGALGDVDPALFARSILQAEQALYTPAELDFSRQVDRSFLPAMIDLTRERGIQLIFVRAPTNVFPDPASAPEGLDQYFGQLNRYLAERDVPMLDLSRVEGIGPEQFVDPHHMTVEGKTIFTGVLAAALEHYIR